MAVLRFLLTAWLALFAAGAVSAQITPGPHLALELVAESAAPVPGSTVMLAVRARPDPGWHGYWINPGDAGVPDRFAWTLPAGATVGEIRYPVPHRLMIAGIMNYVFEGEYAMLAPLSVPAGLAAGTALPVSARIDYLVCTEEVCVPESATVEARLTVGDGAIDPAIRARFDGWRAKLPRPLGSPATFAVAGDTLRIAIPLPAEASVADPYVFPVTERALDHSAPQSVTREDEALIVSTKAGGGASALRSLDGVLALGPDRGLSFTATPGEVAAAASGGGGASLPTILLALGGAVLGGLILNIMPCVFPILSLKALSLARSGVSERAARGEALAYGAGVIAVCVALGGLLLALRAGGATVGWAFQLQDPRVILALLLLVTAIAFNLAGLFELSGSGAVNRLAASGKGGAFLTGALAAFVATPCTGPFMGAALGAALVLPPAAAIGVFAGLGLGIALPFLAIGFVPALRRRLPRPGPWMERLRRVLAVPMFLTALALAWVLGRQAGVDGMTLGVAAALVLVLALWWTGRLQMRGSGRAWLPVLPALLLAVGATVLTTRAPAGAESANVTGEAFSETRLAALRAEGKPVFAYFTADWCLTCKVNEKAAIETASVADAFEAGGVQVLVGDWTNGDPALGRFLESHGRSGVPLYLYYAPGAAVPQILPQVLTPGMLTALVHQGET
ncbi:protein-disulfide reductase DsbD family protein [Sphingomonas gilva]|uniref:protein-disulfide reductase DsbD family protein n=1 Tax=Sphingomonas gilva TaxID=2305907 RepID=UPI001FECD9D5|nr:protein-disulfide reductase DsbD domain-containing protein [Sphingomonas gilva]